MEAAKKRKRLIELLSDLKIAKASGSKTLYFIIIENLPMLTLAFGHVVCREYINSLIDALGQNVAEGGEVYKLQNDQIAVILNTAKPSEILGKDQEIRQFIRKFGQENKNQNLHISSSSGYALIDDEAETVLSRAFNEAMTPHPDQKLALENESEMQQKSLVEMDLANQIEHAISGNKLKFAYQPIIHSRTGEISHYECLLRVENEEGNLESAGSFIPIAERMGFIDVIDIFTLNRTIERLKANPELHLAVNISNLTIGNKKWLKAFFDNITEDTAKRLIIEITETAAAKNLRDTAFFAASLQETGCQIALDDFGSGYTSFRQISALSMDMIKIDGSLIKDIENNRNNQLLVKSFVNYINGLGIKTVAEFVDTGACAKLLIDYGVDYLQGNYFGEAA